MPKKSILALIGLFSLSTISHADSYLDMKTDWLESNDMAQQIDHWLMSKNAIRDEQTYGRSYLLKIPYYEKYGMLDSKKEYPQPYSSELSYGEKTFDKLCKKNKGTPVRAVQKNRVEPIFTVYDPTSERNAQRHYAGCLDQTGSVSALIFEPNKIGETLRVTFFTSTDKEKFNSAKNLEATANKDASQRRYVDQQEQRKLLIAQFRKNIKPGDYSSMGLIVEVKPPIAQIQTNDVLKWVRIDELLPLE